MKLVVIYKAATENKYASGVTAGKLYSLSVHLKNGGNSSNVI